MGRIERIAQDVAVSKASRHFRKRQSALLDLIIAIQQIPAPTFAEAKRAAFIEKKFRKVGLVDVYQDDLGNVYGRCPGTAPHITPAVVISAHSDTVFPLETDLTVRQHDDLWYGPGIGDNSTGVAGLITLARTFRKFGLKTAADLWFVSNVCEEGLGDLRGMRAVVEKFDRNTLYIVVEGGMYGQISCRGIGVKRFKVEIEAVGGHSWGNFGQANAIHEAAHLITAIDKLQPPLQPKTTYNIGVIGGGTSINTIAQSCDFLLDLRSETAPELQRLVKQVDEIVTHARQNLQRKRKSVTINMTSVGNRPAGSISERKPLVRFAKEALSQIGVHHRDCITSSTDANVPLSKGLDAVCVGLTVSGNAHRLNEYIDPSYLPSGLQQLLLLTLAAGGFGTD